MEASSMGLSRSFPCCREVGAHSDVAKGSSSTVDQRILPWTFSSHPVQICHVAMLCSLRQLLAILPLLSDPTVSDVVGFRVSGYGFRVIF